MCIVEGEEFRQVQLMPQPQHLPGQQLLPSAGRQLREEGQDGVEAQVPAPVGTWSQSPIDLVVLSLSMFCREIV